MLARLMSYTTQAETIYEVVPARRITRTYQLKAETVKWEKEAFQNTR